MKIMNIILFRAIFFFGILVIFPSSGYTQDKKVITSFFDKKWLKSVVSIEKMAKREGELKSTPIGSGFLIQSPNKNIVLVSTKQVVFDESQNLIEGLHFQVGKAKTINRAISNQEANKKGYGDWFISNSTDAALRLIPLPISSKAIKMANELDSKELVDFREMVLVNTIQVDTMYQLLIQKGYFTEAEFLVKMKEVKSDYQRKRH